MRFPHTASFCDSSDCPPEKVLIYGILAFVAANGSAAVARRRLSLAAGRVRVNHSPPPPKESGKNPASDVAISSPNIDRKQPLHRQGRQGVSRSLYSSGWTKSPDLLHESSNGQHGSPIGPGWERFLISAPVRCGVDFLLGPHVNTSCVADQPVYWEVTDHVSRIVGSHHSAKGIDDPESRVVWSRRPAREPEARSSGFEEAEGSIRQ